ncbi:hypothetical protein L596_001680 [Steinernema carpocapsae]|uniref:Uncharacterized protein n=1 Tax=Steinernema carpocapsae TaxID=34508 RepID=A0A4V6I7F5_STECR|nr:hypothetical protein L596_001680 [Steinernema carpocapsae]
MILSVVHNPGGIAVGYCRYYATKEFSRLQAPPRQVVPLSLLILGTTNPEERNQVLNYFLLTSYCSAAYRLHVA